mgnify:FL=1
MSRGSLRLGSLGVALACVCGCAPLLLGAGAAGGYAISRDSIKNTFEVSETHLYQVSREVIGDVGFVTTEDARRGLIQATVEGATVTISVTPASDHRTELKVKARNKLPMPKIRVAQDVYNRIVNRLN